MENKDSGSVSGSSGSGQAVPSSELQAEASEGDKKPRQGAQASALLPFNVIKDPGLPVSALYPQNTNVSPSLPILGVLRQQHPKTRGERREGIFSQASLPCLRYRSDRSFLEISSQITRARIRPPAVRELKMLAQNSDSKLDGCPPWGRRHPCPKQGSRGHLTAD